MATRPLRAESIRQIVLGRIRSGQYAVGSRMPGTRALAEELGANRNTVNKALQALAQAGLLALTPGRGGGAFVLANTSGDEAADEVLRADMRRLVQAALGRGLSRAQTLTIAQQALADVYDAPLPRIKFLECNAHDAQTLAGQLARLLDAPLEIGVLEQEDLPSLGARYDLIITTFHHLAEVSRALHHERAKVVGVNALPTPETALAIARIEAHRLGLICSRETTVQSMKHLVASYRPTDTLAVALLDDADAVRRLAATSEALIVTYNCADEVTALSGRQPDVIVAFQLEPQSVAFVRQRVRQLQGEHAPAAPSLQG